MNELLTWETAGTLTVATAVTLLIVQYIKPLAILQRVDTRIIAYFVALFVLLMATAFTTPSNISAYVLALVNAFIVAAAALGAYEVTFKQVDAAKKKL